jgi:hypothetical protein
LTLSSVILTRSRATGVGVDGLVGVLLFLCAATWGGVSYARYVRAGGHPFFYQSYFEPAVMTACGKGFFVTPSPPPPSLRAFLLEQTDHFSCDELPRDLKVGTDGLYQRPWRYLMTTVAVTWMVLGISWSGLAPLFGVLYGATTVLLFGWCRLVLGRIASTASAVALCVSPLQLANLPNLRDYAKAPFTIALIWILTALVVRPWRWRAMLVLSFCYGLVMGIGYGFRTDLLIDIPPFLLTIALFVPGGVLRNVPVKMAAVVLGAAGFVAAGWPIIRTIVSSGGCQWHVLLLGLTSPFNDALGVTGGAYGWGHLYNDEYVWATVSSYAGRFRPDLGYLEYCSHEYDVASWDYLRRVLLTFPADMVTRAYASVLQVLDLPFQRFTLFRHLGPLLAAAFVLVISTANLRLALFAVFLIMYFGGYPAIQFLPRHYFPFEFIAWVVLAFLTERGVGLAVQVARGGFLRSALVATNIRRAARCAVVVIVTLLVPLGTLRWYQNGRARELLASYAAAPADPWPLAPSASGALRVTADPNARALSKVELMAALGRQSARLVEAVVDAAACQPGTTLTFRYDPAYPDVDFSRTVALPVAGEGGGRTRFFEPVYASFTGIDVSDPSPACRPEISVVRDVNRFPLLLSAQLPPGWASHPQYQRIASFR